MSRLHLLLLIVFILLVCSFTVDCRRVKADRLLECRHATVLKDAMHVLKFEAHNNQPHSVVEQPALIPATGMRGPKPSAELLEQLELQILNKKKREEESEHKEQSQPSPLLEQQNDTTTTALDDSFNYILENSYFICGFCGGASLLLYLLHFIIASSTPLPDYRTRSRMINAAANQTLIASGENEANRIINNSSSSRHGSFSSDDDDMMMMMDDELEGEEHGAQEAQRQRQRDALGSLNRIFDADLFGFTCGLLLHRHAGEHLRSLHLICWSIFFTVAAWAIYVFLEAPLLLKWAMSSMGIGLVLPGTAAIALQMGISFLQWLMWGLWTMVGLPTLRYAWRETGKADRRLGKVATFLQVDVGREIGPVLQEMVRADLHKKRMTPVEQCREISQ